jgi:two-component system, NarL family, response regulator DevR
MGSGASGVRVLVVDDHEVVRAGVAAMLRASDWIALVAEAETAEEAVAEAARNHPDVVVMDVKLDDRSGIEATREIRAARPATRVIIFTAFADDEAVFASLMAGASGYVLKRTRADDLVRAIRVVAGGESLLDPAVTEAIFEQVRRSKPLVGDERLSRLSPREDRVLDLVAQGRTNRQIASSLNLSERTVKNYVSEILVKLEVARRAEAAAYLAARRRANW